MPVLIAPRRRRRLLVLGLLAVVVAGVVGVRLRHGRTVVPMTAGQVQAALFAELQPVEIPNCRPERFGEPHDGGYVMCANLLESVKAGYSYGISGYDQWGCDVARRLDVRVHQYDCFNLEKPTCARGVTVFHAECIAPSRSVDDAGRVFDTFESQFARNGDGAKHVVVKIDVEGAEWQTFLDTPPEVFNRIDQLVVEFHGVDREHYLAAARRLKQFFLVGNLHINNYACAPGLDPFPAWAYEVLFVNKRIASAGGSRPPGPHPLDAPNKPTAADCQAAGRVTADGGRRTADGRPRTADYNGPMLSFPRSFAAAGALAGLLLAAPDSRVRAQAPPGPHHVLRVELAPATHRVTVGDRVTVPAGAREFLLNSRLRIVKSVPAVEEVPVGDVSPFLGINAAPGTANLPVKRYRLRSAPAGGGLTLEYAGAVDFGLSDQKEEYTRGFRETTGVVSKDGVYLAGGSFWYPHFGQDLLTFEMTVRAPAGWHVISQGSGTSRDPKGQARWSSPDPMDEIYLVGGPLTVARDRAGSVETLVYLHERDDALASKYLTTTAQYLEMYAKLIGPYPYDKFALVENFWETGYGMPSFTLLGREIIRFPFILHSSYPHEILHNWWGNSVFVDYGSGNWAEGLTAYLADHLVQEQRKRGPEHRRASLQKYRDYVKDGRDFALTDFRGRDSAATEAVGYGKTLMTFHMLRRRIGDERFKAVLARLYKDYKGKRASWADVQRVSQAAAGPDIAGFFDQWIGRPGAPALEARVTSVVPSGAGYAIAGTLRQTQPGPAYRLDVPVVVETDRGFKTFVVPLGSSTADIDLVLGERPLALHVDPYFDLFRRLDPRETPPSISQVFGEPRILAVLPAAAPARTQAAYRELLTGWQTATHEIDVRLDSDVRALPSGTSVWLLGRENRLALDAFSKQAGLAIERDALRLDGQAMPFAAHTFAAMTRHPVSADKVVGWIAVDPIEAMAGLGRKLPHYGKYSYVGFEGAEPANTVSGEWKQADSPMRVDLREMAGGADAAAKAFPADPAKALADLPPVFSRTTMTETIATLTAPAMEGRGVGTKGLPDAAAFIAARFKSYGLLPGGDRGTYLQAFTIAKGPDGRPHQAANVIGYLPGTRADWKTQSAIVSAHYDHLGRGWPDVHTGDEGKVHPGADDNASGVAVLLELARAMAAGDKPSRNVVFVAFAGEEAGLAGSRHFTGAPSPFPLDGLIGVINLDTVGRLFDQRVSILATGTAAEWQHIFRGAGFVTGVESRNIPEAIQSSDQAPFIERGIPAVQIFTGAHADYHRPADTAEKIDADGLVKVAALVREGIAYLGERPEKLTVTIASAAGAPPRPTASDVEKTSRRASLGTVPDFAFPGPGVRADGITEGSPAAKAGIQRGDVILKIDDQPIANLQDYSNLLRALKPGQTVTVVVKRGDEELKMTITLAER